MTRFRMRPRPSKLEAVLALALLAPLLMLLSFAHAWDGLGRLASMPAFWLFSTAALSAWPAWRWTHAHLARTASLTLDDEGMSMASGLPVPWRWAVRADWRCRWNEIRSVAVIDRLEVVHIRPSRSGRSIVLRPGDWVREGAPDSPAASMKASALWQALEAAGLFGRSGRSQSEALNFNLWKHPGTRAALVVAACLAAYGALDGLVQREAWAGYDWRYYLPHHVVGGLGFAAMPASYAGLIRVNQVAGGPLEDKAYRRNAACDALVPLEEGLPVIEYSSLARDYWCRQPAEVLHQVPVRRGLFGLYQVDLSAHTEAIRRLRGGG